GHDDDLVVTKLVGVEFLAANAGAQRRDERHDGVAGQHAVEAYALDVEDLAAQRQHRLVLTVSRLLGAAAGAVALDDKDFAFGRVAFLTVRQLARQRRAIEYTLAARQFAGLPGGFARGSGFHHFADDLLGFRRMFFKPAAQSFQYRTLDNGAHLGGDEFVF